MNQALPKGFGDPQAFLGTDAAERELDQMGCRTMAHTLPLMYGPIPVPSTVPYNLTSSFAH